MRKKEIEAASISGDHDSRRWIVHLLFMNCCPGERSPYRALRVMRAIEPPSGRNPFVYVRGPHQRVAGVHTALRKQLDKHRKRSVYSSFLHSWTARATCPREKSSSVLQSIHLRADCFNLEIFLVFPHNSPFPEGQPPWLIGHVNLFRSRHLDEVL